MAPSLPDGSPGRPFLRFEAEEGGPHFDFHDIRDGQHFLRGLSHSAYRATRWMAM